MNQSAPKTTSPLPQSSKNWFGLDFFSYKICLIISTEIVLKCHSGQFVKMFLAQTDEYRQIN
jgi:hypothetical protein